jgi:PadR family transcriptional regulator PadR
MQTADPQEPPRRPSAIERQARKIALPHVVTSGWRNIPAVGTGGSSASGNWRATGLRGKALGATLRGMAMGPQRRTDLLRGVLDLCLLAVMDEGPAYGYEMTKRLRDRGLAIVGEGSIYPLLGRLERDGLVETYRAASNGGPPRKYYRPSGAGRLALAVGVSEWRAARDAVDAVLAPVKVEVAS